MHSESNLVQKCLQDRISSFYSKPTVLLCPFSSELSTYLPPDSCSATQLCCSFVFSRACDGAFHCMTSSISITVTKCRHFSMGKYPAIWWGTPTSWSWDGNVPTLGWGGCWGSPYFVSGHSTHLPAQVCATDSMGKEPALCHVKGVPTSPVAEKGLWSLQKTEQL